MQNLIVSGMFQVKETPYFQKKTTPPFDDHGARVFAPEAGGIFFLFCNFLFLFLFMLVGFNCLGWFFCLFTEKVIISC